MKVKGGGRSKESGRSSLNNQVCLRTERMPDPGVISLDSNLLGRTTNVYSSRLWEQRPSVY